MVSNPKRILIIFLFSLLLFTFVAPIVLAVEYLPLVPCGLKSQPEGKDLAVLDYTLACTTCDFFRLGKNVIDLILYGIIPPAATLLFVVAGFLILTAGGTVGRVSLGKSIFWNVFIGLLIIFSAWLVTNTILKSFAPEEVGDAWYKLECAAKSEIIVTELPEGSTYGCLASNGIYKCTDPKTPTNDFSCKNAVVNEKGQNCADLGLTCIQVPLNLCDKKPSVDSEVQQNIIFAEVLRIRGVGSSTNADCGSFHSKRTLSELREGKFPAICSPKCESKIPNCISTGRTVNPALLSGLIDLAIAGLDGLDGVGGDEEPEEFNFFITSLTTGIHSENSSHYSGEGVDIIVSPSGDQKAYMWQRVVNFLNGVGGDAFCETKFGNEEDSCKFSEDVDHIHWTLRR